MMDVTKAMELEHLLRIQDKMTSLGRVAAGIAHEIRNPLSGINIYLNALQRIYEKGGSSEKVRDILEQLLSASNKIESIIKRVMDFSRPTAPKLVLTDLNTPIEEAIELSSVTLRKRGVKIEKTLAGDLPLCLADPHMIEQVVLNLVTNAAEAMKNIEGTKRIRVASSLDNDRIIVKVSDSGSGVPSDQRDDIFDPFYTTKSGSTGIGLSIAHRIVADHGGSLDVFESKWGGAEFTISIPLTERAQDK
jgi:signal transduction histidine kinase